MIVADTHAWLWWITAPETLSVRALEALDATDRIGISPITCVETASLARRQRILPNVNIREWIARALALPKIELLDLRPEIAVEAGLLSDTTIRDPADRIIVATALFHGSFLVTKDARIHQANIVDTIW